MESFSPRPSLRDRVLSIQRIESTGHVSNILPSTSAVLGLQTSGRILSENGPLSAFGITGIQAGARRYEYNGPTETFLVRFRPEGAACLGLPAIHFSNASRSLDELLENSIRRRASRLLDETRAARDARARIALLEDFLEALPFERDPLVAHAVARFRSEARSAEGSAISVANVAREVGLSERQLERRFLDRVGITPKRFSTLARFERAKDLAKPGVALSTVAFDAGYADQAHFIREFRKFTGTTPGRFLQTTNLFRP